MLNAFQPLFVRCISVLNKLYKAQFERRSESFVYQEDKERSEGVVVVVYETYPSAAFEIDTVSVLIIKRIFRFS